MVLDRSVAGCGEPTASDIPRVLVVDDEETVMLTIKNILELDGYEVTGTTSASEARDLVRTQHFDLLLTDLCLDEAADGVDGLQLVKELRNRCADAAAVMLTGYASLESAVGALREGACDYLSKPCDVLELRTTVSRGIERCRVSAELHGRMNTLQAEVNAQAAAQREFISKVSHDLRTPLTFIKGMASLRRRRASHTPETEPLLDALQQIEGCADRMARQVDDLAESAQA